MHSILGNTVMVFSVKHNEELKIEEIEEAYFLQCSKSSFPEHNKSDKEGDLSCTIIKEEKLAEEEAEFEIEKKKEFEDENNNNDDDDDEEEQSQEFVDKTERKDVKQLDHRGTLT